jgi:hypothetical protein
VAVDDLKTEYHLTESGWTTGTSFFFGKTTNEIASPPDRVLTMLEHISQSSRFSSAQTSWTEIWRSPKVTDEELAKLQQKFPRP